MTLGNVLIACSCYQQSQQLLAGKPQLLHLVGAQTLHPSQAHRQQQRHVLGEALRALRGNGRDDVPQAFQSR